MENNGRSRVLCVEDNEDECDLVRAILFEHDVTCVTTIKEACSLIEESAYDLLLIDVHLPDGSGLHFCRDISSKNAETPIIIITGDDYVTTADAVLAGAQAFLSKSKPSYVEDLYYEASSLT